MRHLLASALLLFSAAGYSQVQPANPQQAQPAEPAASPQQTQPAAEPDPTLKPQDTPDPSQQQATDYGGPAILSRGAIATVTRGELMRFRPFVSLNGIVDSDLQVLSVDSNGQIPQVSGYGAEALAGVSGSHQWKTTLLDLNYRGSLRHYNKATYYDGMDNSLNLGLKHQQNRQWTLEFDQNAARYSRSFFLPTGFTQFAYNTVASSLTANDMFDVPTYVSTSTGRAIYQKSARLAFGMSGSGFIIRRHSDALAGLTGFSATGDVTYRVSRFQTIGVDYTFNRFGFTGQFGGSDIHGVSINFASRLSKRWELAFRFGGYRVDSTTLMQVALDPALAAIFGQQTGIGTFHGVSYGPHGEVRLSRGFNRGSWSVGYSRAVTPGNGVYLTSTYDSAQAGVNYQGSRRVAVSGGVAYTSYSSLTQTIGTFRNYTAGGGASVKLSRYLSMIARLDGRRYDIYGSGYLRNAYRATLGLAWSPGDYPVAIW